MGKEVEPRPPLEVIRVFAQWPVEVEVFLLLEEGGTWVFTRASPRARGSWLWLHNRQV